MSLIIVQPDDIASIPDLERLAVQFIYDSENMRIESIHLMERSISWWKEEIDRGIERRKLLLKADADILSADLKEILYRIMFMSKHIRDRDIPHTWTYTHVQNRKRHKINYKKANFMRVKFSGAHSMADYARGQRLLMAWNEKNKELL